jgi:hypothetical protein
MDPARVELRGPANVERRAKPLPIADALPEAGAIWGIIGSAIVSIKAAGEQANLRRQQPAALNLHGKLVS